jgi:hypothetical protein
VEKVDGYATLALRTSPMILVGSGSSFNVSSSSSLCTIDSFTMTGFGSVPSDPTSAVYSVAGNLVDLRLDISTPSELSLLTVSGASVNLGQAFNKVTCLEPPRFLGDIRTLDDEMTAIVSSETGTILRGSASIVGETAAVSQRPFSLQRNRAYFCSRLFYLFLSFPLRRHSSATKR